MRMDARGEASERTDEWAVCRFFVLDADDERADGGQGGAGGERRGATVSRRGARGGEETHDGYGLET